MSEYQYYEFQAIDRSLTAEERATIDRLSRRVKSSATKASFIYSHGDFPGDPKDVLAAYFDIMYYIANWGTQQLLFRFPKSSIDPASIEPYLVEGCIELSFHKEWAILDWEFHQEEGFDYWIEGEGTLAELVDLRREILQQDYRGLYLAWLNAITVSEEYADIDPDSLEPPVPLGLQELSPAQKAFIHIFDVEESLVAIARSASTKQTAISEKSLLQAIPRLSTAEQRNFLERLAKGEPNLSIAFQQKLREIVAAPSTPDRTRRTVQELLDRSSEWTRETERQQKAEAKAKRIQDLQALAKREPQVWEEIEFLLQKTRAQNYDRAVQLLVQLRDLAELQNSLPSFQNKIEDIRERYSRRAGFLSRLRAASL
ncbi:hypothetical protein V0288_22085 [Pannus brasiliensis CCIBt3594]|uniref:Uncharacterized protein n=1 Tax=Pannus brasiliensis CCIBt3594 TaxID=1427578 RepID=A0AAW9QX55_9CHRO